MEEFKKTNFKKDYPDADFPVYDVLTKNKTDALRAKLKDNLSIDIATTFAYYFGEFEGVNQIKTYKATDSDFCLESSCCDLQIKHGDTIYIYWSGDNQIIEIGFRALASFWEYIWYPAIDDIVLFDKTCSWLLAIDHEGHIYSRTDK